MPIHIREIYIDRGYGSTAEKPKPFKAKVKVGWDERDNVMQVEVDEQTTLDMIRIVAPLIVEACKSQMEDVVASAELALLPPPIKVEAAPIKQKQELDDDDIPF